jgi:[CysO sulfur-carrier protein]-S-L-cysteine hydrolase
VTGLHSDERTSGEALALHGGARVTRLPRVLHDELVAWARAGLPSEAWGIVAGTAPLDEGGRPLRFHPMTNAAASPHRYGGEPQEQLRVMLAIDDAGEATWGIFHSHVRSPAEPSPTDISLAFYPDALYLICSLSDMDAPCIRAWSIREGDVAEVALEVE